MGSDAAELFFGMEISKKDFDRLETVFFDDGDERDEQSALVLDNPYETDDYYVLVRASRSDVENGGRCLGKSVDVDPTWQGLFDAFALEHKIKPKSVGWHLVGHYV